VSAARDDATGSARAHRMRSDVVAVIAVGGALGAVARYEVAQLIHVAGDSFPWATFVTNLSGAFVLGVFLTVVLDRRPASRYVRAFFAVGFLGAFTTFSTMAVETVTLLKDGFVALGVGYLIVSVGAGLAVTALGVAIARALPRASSPRGGR
jgi:CrcB protein